MRCIILFICLACILHSQTITASLEGTITDASGGRVPGAKVRVTNTATGIATNVEAGPDGRFVAVSLPAGTYSVGVQFQVPRRRT